MHFIVIKIMDGSRSIPNAYFFLIFVFSALFSSMSCFYYHCEKDEYNITFDRNEQDTTVWYRYSVL